MIKKTILIDLDGVLNNYKGDFDRNFIPNIKEGAKEFLKEVTKKYTIKIFTTRNRIITAKWLISNEIEQYIDDITNIKEPCWLYIDDRCINFEGNFKKLKKEIDDFQPWYKIPN